MSETAVPRDSDFQEIAHSGGKITVKFSKDDQGRRFYQTTWSHARANAVVVTGVYALLQGVPISKASLGVRDEGLNPPIPGCLLVYLASDSEGKFGNECPKCGGYWRSDHWPGLCPYCAQVAQSDGFLTRAQRNYIAAYCKAFQEALHSDQLGELVIDMDVVADAVTASTPKPPFYYSEQRQQSHFACQNCRAFTDVLGRFAYCCQCGMRNELSEFRSSIAPAIRRRIEDENAYESSVKETVGAFDSLTKQYVRQLVNRVPLTEGRRNRLEKRFHNLSQVDEDLHSIFDIRLFRNISPDDIEFAKLMFFRRHVYEHNGGEVDEKYITDSGDTSVRLKQILRETKESAHRTVNLTQRMVENLHRGFHSIIPYQIVEAKAS